MSDERPPPPAGACAAAPKRKAVAVSRAADTWLDSAALRDWRACARRFWLGQQQAVAPCSADADADHGPGARRTDPADHSAVDSAGAAGRSDSPAQPSAALPGSLAEAALRASYPLATVLQPPAAHDAAAWAQAEARSRQLLSGSGPAAAHEPGWALIGACLSSRDGVRVRVDVVQRGAHGWRLFKLRWATVADEADVDEMALAAHVAAHGGLRVASVGLLLVDTDFLYPGHGLYAGLLREVDLGPVLGTRDVPAWLLAMQALRRAASRPPVPLGAPCTRDGGCPQLSACDLPCEAARPDDPRTRLDILGRELADELRHEGHHNVHSVPLARLVNPRLRRAAQAVQQGRPVVEPAAGPWLAALPWPRHWLRIETIGFAIPAWPGTRPYQVLPFQCSLDSQAQPGAAVQHQGWLAPAGADPRPGFVQRLLQLLGADDGPVLAYNAGFERNRITELARQAQHSGDAATATALEALLPRIVDLFALARANAYHPDMAGSWSARAVFEAWVPEAGAHHFALPGWRSLLHAYGATVQQGLPQTQVAVLRRALLAHGQRHTAALRGLTERLAGGG